METKDSITTTSTLVGSDELDEFNRRLEKSLTITDRLSSCQCEICGSEIAKLSLYDHMRSHYEDANKPVFTARRLPYTTLDNDGGMCTTNTFTTQGFLLSMPNYTLWPKRGQLLMLQRYFILVPDCGYEIGSNAASYFSELRYFREEVTLSNQNPDIEKLKDCARRMDNLSRQSSCNGRFCGLEDVRKSYVELCNAAFS